MTDSIKVLTAEILAFRDERDWGQFHSLRNLIAGLTVEAAELQELVLWKTDTDITDALGGADYRQRMSDELADVAIYVMTIASGAGIELGSAVREKLAANALKYPVALSRGSAKKYTELSEEGSP